MLSVPLTVATLLQPLLPISSTTTTRCSATSWKKEVKAVDNVLNNIKRPFTAIMGGSKVSTKIGIIENLMDKVDNLILCGGMTYTFAKALGGNVGQSICENDKLDLARHHQEG